MKVDRSGVLSLIADRAQKMPVRSDRTVHKPLKVIIDKMRRPAILDISAAAACAISPFVNGLENPLDLRDVFEINLLHTYPVTFLFRRCLIS